MLFIVAILILNLPLKYYINLLCCIIGGWTNVGEVKPDEALTYEVMGLTAKKEYKFRIRAVNKVGSSEPAPLSKVVLAKDPWGKITLFYFKIL